MKLVRSAEVPWQDTLDRGRFGQRMRPLGGSSLKVSVYELPPGKKSWPLHFHHLTEEALYVLSGTASVRTPEGLTPIGPGDHVSFPAGGPAHQLVNDGTEPLVYLGMSAGRGADIVEYPESHKVGCSVSMQPHPRRFLLDVNRQPAYLDGEDDAEPGQS